jgi:hypothetical protein
MEGLKHTAIFNTGTIEERDDFQKANRKIFFVTETIHYHVIPINDPSVNKKM